MSTKYLYKGDSLIDLIEYRATVQPNNTAYIHLKDRDGISEEINYADFEQRVKRLAAKLQQFDVSGERIVLMYPPGIDYIVAYFAVIFAGAIAVPVYEPRQSNHFNRLERVLADSKPKVLLTNEKIVRATNDEIMAKLSQFDATWLTTDAVDFYNDDLAWEPITLSDDSVVFLQYTSGSTGSPKGVMVSNGNLLHNSEMIRLALGQDEDSCMVTWLPPYHDMGLIGGLIQPLFVGYPCVILSPISVIQRPIKWFNAIRDYKATVTGGPNFMYEACVKRIRDKQLDDCDLSTLTTAFNGAEPINNEVLDQFSQRFGQYGFKRSTHLPCYGMAETTLIVSGADFSSEPVVKYFNKEFLHKNKALVTSKDQSSQPLVSCGKAVPDLTVKIVDPETCKELSENLIGEVWVQGDSIAKGYWQKAPVTGQDFVGILDGDHEDRYFRTGDLAFMHEGEIYITGRIKDLIIVRGKNHYPQDIEATTSKSSDRLKPHTTAAFSIVDDGSEKLVLFQEIDRKAEQPEKNDIHAAIQEAIAEEHGIQLHDIVFIRPGALPKTTSGKLQRGLAKKVYLEQHQVEQTIVNSRETRKVTE